MIDNNNIPVGYKDSPVGIIPQEWEVKRLGEVCHDNGKYGINAPAVPYEDKLPTYLRITDIDSNGNFIKEDKMSVDNPCSSQFVLKEGDIVFARTGATVGKTYLYKTSDGELVYAGFLICFSLNENEVVPYYIKAYTETSMYNNWVRVISQRSGQPGINSFEYGSLVLPIPPLAEQKKIAEILCTWDDAIEKQSKLIEKLELRKRGLMQRLLTGKTRLPGFTEPWKKIKLGDVCCIVTGRLDANAMVSNGEYPFFTCAKEVYKINNYSFDTEALLVSGNGEYVGYVHYYKGKFNAYQRTYVLDGFNCNIFYMYYALKQYLPKRIMRTKSNSNTPYIVKDTLFDMELLLPSDVEQKLIAKLISSADKEIETQRKKLETLRQQKQGLMQQLLTGKIRVRI